jgi:K+-sensing histidine kinase KdpD
VLARLLGEAVRSSAQDDWVEITWQAEHDQLVLTVEDEGAGTAMPPSMAANDDHVTQDTRGIGLRLSLARTLIQAHEGTMEVEALPRIGTRVTVSLPARRLRQETETAAG